MAGYKVSYKVLSQQGEKLKAVAKQMDDYASRLDAIRGKLGSDNMLSSVRQNLQKLSQQFGETRATLTLSGQVISQCVEGYSGQEKTVVQKVNSTRAHNRDFYKNPVTVNSTVNMSVAGAVDPSVAASTVIAESVPVETVSTSEKTAGGMDPKVMGATVAGGAVAGAAGLFGVQKLRAYLKQKEVDGVQQKGRSEPAVAASETSEEDPEVLLARALEEAGKYRNPAISPDKQSVSPSPDSTPKFGTVR